MTTPNQKISSAKTSPQALAIGQQAPDFALAATGNTKENTKVCLADFKGRKIVLYFYPKDDTPGCTTEAKDFTAAMPDFDKADTVIIGVSKDDLKSHDQFREKYCLPFPLLSDPEGAMCEAYGVWIEKSMFGKKYMGIDRATFLIDAEGIVQKIWRKVSVTGHVQEVLAAAQKL